MAFANLNKEYLKTPQNKKNRRRLTTVIMIFLIALLVPSFFAFLGLTSVLRHGKAFVAAYKDQNFGNLKKEVGATKGAIQQVNISLGLLFWLRIVPFLGGYYLDIKGLAGAGAEQLSAADTLLSDLSSSEKELGFDGHPKSGPDRVTQAVRLLDKSTPLLDKVSSNLKKGADQVRNIDSSKYPEKLAGKDIKRNIELAKNFILGTYVAVGDGREALKLAPAALGIPSAKNYFLLFQNDKEIRATGGFLTAYATLTINNGQINTTTSDDIYRLDERLLATCKSKICPLSPPSPIVKYLPEVTGKPRSAWSMRDSNLSPDVPTSAKEFERMYQLLGGGLSFDGIIYIDSQVVEELIKVTGPIEVFGTSYSSEKDKRCNCPNVIYELENYAQVIEKGEQDRKAILGVLMQQILARSIGSDVEKIPSLLETIARLANHKHVIFFAHDEGLQNALSKINWTGQIKQYDGDYLHINDSNFAGGKSNLYVDQTVTQEINPQKDGTVKKKVTIEYKNSERFNSWLNGINRDYVRIYVPKGGKLISSKGSEDQVTTIEELGKTVFEAFIQVRPQNSRKLEFEFSVPYSPKGDYRLLIQKQPGAKDFHYIIKVNGSKKADFKLDFDKQFKFDI